MAAAFRELVTSDNEKGQPRTWSNIMKDTETKRFALSV
jgi:hypothetical protein